MRINLLPTRSTGRRIISGQRAFCTDERLRLAPLQRMRFAIECLKKPCPRCRDCVHADMCVYGVIRNRSPGRRPCHLLRASRHCSAIFDREAGLLSGLSGFQKNIDWFCAGV